MVSQYKLVVLRRNAFSAAIKPCPSEPLIGLRVVVKDRPALGHAEDFGDVERKLQLIRQLLNRPDIIVYVDSNALNDANCLFYSVMHQLEDVRELVEARKNG